MNHKLLSPNLELCKKSIKSFWVLAIQDSERDL